MVLTQAPGNDSETSRSTRTGAAQSRSGLVLFELIDKDGAPIIQADNPHDLILTAERLWPDQEQDPDRTGKGWDIAVVGADR